MRAGEEKRERARKTREHHRVIVVDRPDALRTRALLVFAENVFHAKLFRNKGGGDGLVDGTVTAILHRNALDAADFRIVEK